jgi:hypothetical protein
MEDNIYAFLGIQVQFDSKNGTVTFTQNRLIHKMIKLCGLTDANPRYTQANRNPLRPRIAENAPHQETWGYATVIVCFT